MTNTPSYSPTPWNYEYSPYTHRAPGVGDTGRVGDEIPAFEVFDCEGNKLFDTNEHMPCETQEANARLAVAAPAQALMLDLVLHGLMTLGEGDAEFDGVMYWFDHTKPDWCVSVVDAIGWEVARNAIAEVTAGDHRPK